MSPAMDILLKCQLTTRTRLQRQPTKFLANCFECFVHFIADFRYVKICCYLRKFAILFRLYKHVGTHIITSAEEGGYVFGAVCLSVCLSVGLLTNL